MNDEKPTKEEEKQEEKPATDNSGKGDKSETSSLVEQAYQAAERLEQANRKQEELLDRQERILAREALGGRSEAGQNPPKKEEKDPIEYANSLIERGENILIPKQKDEIH